MTLGAYRDCVALRREDHPDLDERFSLAPLDPETALKLLLVAEPMGEDPDEDPSEDAAHEG